MAAPARKQDPFYTVKEKVTASAARVNGDLESLNTLPAGSSDAASAVVSLKTNLQQMTVHVNDLAQTITIVESNRPRFAAIDDNELNNRKKFVAEMRTKISQFNDRLAQVSSQNSQSNRSNNRPTSGGKNEKDSASQPSSSSSSSTTTSSSTSSSTTRKQLIGDVNTGRFAGAMAAENKRATEAVVSNAATQSQLLIDQQDEELGEMSVALDRLQNIAHDINKEMKTQEVVMKEAEDEMDEAKNRLDWALKKMDKLLKTSDKGRICCIIVLFILCLGLLFGIIYG